MLPSVRIISCYKTGCPFWEAHSELGGERERVCFVVSQSLETKPGCLGAKAGQVKKQVWLDGAGEGRLWGYLPSKVGDGKTAPPGARALRDQ